MSETTDMVIIDKTVQEREAFTALYTAHWREVYRFAYFYLGTREDAEDAVQETFLRALRGFSGLRKQEQFKSWLYTILLRVCKQRIPSLISRRQETDVDEAYALADAATGDRALSLTLRHEITQLSQREQQIIWLGVVAGYRSSEIAQILHIPAGTVRSRLSRALAKLRDRLGEDCFN